MRVRITAKGLWVANRGRQLEAGGMLRREAFRIAELEAELMQETRSLDPKSKRDWEVAEPPLPC